MKVLVVTPSYYKDGRIAVSPKMIAGLIKQQLTNHKYSWIVISDDVFPNSDIVHINMNIAHKLNIGRKVMLHEGYDAMFWLPDDQILGKEDTISKMCDYMQRTGKQIVSLPSRLRPSSVNHSHIALMEYACTEERGVKVPDEPKIGEGKPSVLVKYDKLNEWYKMIKWELPFQVAGGGLPMISREVLTQVFFRQESQSTSDDNIGADLRFFSDAYRLGYKTTILPISCGHIDKDINTGEEVEYWLDDKFFKELVDKNIEGEILKKYIGIGNT